MDLDERRVTREPKAVLEVEQYNVTIVVDKNVIGSDGR